MVEERNASLLSYNSFQIEAKAYYLLHIESSDEIFPALCHAKYRSLPKLILGGGSNLLLLGDQRKVVLKIGIPGIQIIKEDNENVWVKVGAGVIWHHFVIWAVDHGLGGIENLSLIPGTIGAAPIQNIGAYGVEIASSIELIDALERSTGNIVRFSSAQCRFGYRNSIFKNDAKDKFILTAVTFRLAKKPVFNLEYGAIKQTLNELGVMELSVKAVSEAVIKIRQSKLPDPAVIGNAGSFFKNPVVDKLHFEALKEVFPEIPSYEASEGFVKIPAGWLIEKQGWKGKRIGNAGVHENQALVLVNHGQATGKEILGLSEKIMTDIQRKFGIALEREVNVV